MRIALCSTFGEEVGRDATAEALAFAWEHWDQVRHVGNPAGYLWGVGRHKAVDQLRRRRPHLPAVPAGRLPWVEPGLPAALTHLSRQQRTVVMLVHCFEWTYAEVAELLGVGKTTVQVHAERGLARLRKELGVTDEQRPS